jgi:beta-fructofuranosidase
MAFSLPDHWVWDFWLADDGANYHLFYLHAPHALGNPDLRHRNARIGHATSTDLVQWQDHGQIFETGPAGSFDDTATWTGSVVRGPDGLWRLYYTGSRFLSPTSNANVETVGMAVPTPATTKRSARRAGPRRPGATPGCSPIRPGSGTC